MARRGLERTTISSGFERRIESERLGSMTAHVQGLTFHHVGVAVHQMQSAIESYKKLFGYELTSGPFDDPIQGVTVCFLSLGPGDTTIELVAPLASPSPIDRVLKKGGGTYHVCYEVADLDAALAYLTGNDCVQISDPAPAVAFEMRKIAWLMTDTGLLVELIQA
jgi:methylmalonyl-CoA/ethylmalonyl-CoA epimerase